MRAIVWSLHQNTVFRRTIDLLEQYGFEHETCIGSITECREALEGSWSTVDAVLCISPVALCVRMISPLLRGKRIDPAVITLSPLGKTAIPIIGDHRGGAMLCEFLSDKIGCRCVETSLSSEKGSLSLDDLAFRLRLEPVNAGHGLFEELVKKLAYNNRVSVYVDDSVMRVLKSMRDDRVRRLFDNTVRASSPSDAELCLVKDTSECGECSGCCLVMKKIAVGLGFCSTARISDVMNALNEVLGIFGFPLNRVDVIAVPSIRAGHPVVKELGSHGLRVEIVDVGEAREHGVPNPQARHGVRSLCEAVARTVLGGGKTLITKARFGNVTVSIVEEELEDA